MEKTDQRLREESFLKAALDGNETVLTEMVGSITAFLCVFCGFTRVEINLLFTNIASQNGAKFINQMVAHNYSRSISEHYTRLIGSSFTTEMISFSKFDIT